MLYLKSFHFICFGSSFYLYLICLIILPTSVSLKFSTYTNHSTLVFCILRMFILSKYLRENARERKYRGKKKRRKIKVELNVKYYFYLLIQTHFVYFNHQHKYLLLILTHHHLNVTFLTSKLKALIVKKNVNPEDLTLC